MKEITFDYSSFISFHSLSVLHPFHPTGLQSFHPSLPTCFPVCHTPLREWAGRHGGRHQSVTITALTVIRTITQPPPQHSHQPLRRTPITLLALIHVLTAPPYLSPPSCCPSLPTCLLPAPSLLQYVFRQLCNTVFSDWLAVSSPLGLFHFGCLSLYIPFPVSRSLSVCVCPSLSLYLSLVLYFVILHTMISFPSS